MRINEFSKATDLSIDTLRYYIEIGLLTPKSINKRFVFEDRDLKIVKKIKQFKKYGFSLEEMKPYINFMMVDIDYNFFESKEFANLLEQKEKLLFARIEELNQNLKELRDYKKEYSINSCGERFFNIARFSLFDCANADIQINEIEKNNLIKGSLIYNNHLYRIEKNIIFFDGIDISNSNYKIDMESTIKFYENYGIKNNPINNFSSYLYKYFDIYSKNSKNIYINNAESSALIPGILRKTTNNQLVILSGDAELYFLSSYFDKIKNNILYLIKSPDDNEIFSDNVIDLFVDFFSYNTKTNFSAKEYSRILNKSGKILSCVIFNNDKYVSQGKEFFDMFSNQNCHIKTLFEETFDNTKELFFNDVKTKYKTLRLIIFEISLG